MLLLHCLHTFFKKHQYPHFHCSFCVRQVPEDRITNTLFARHFIQYNAAHN